MRTKYTTADPAHSALLTIDVQCDFTGAGGAAPIAGTSECVPAMRRIVGAYRNHRLPIAHVVRLYASDGNNVDLCRREMTELGTELVRPGTVGAELVPSLKPNPEVQLDASMLLGGNLQTLGANDPDDRPRCQHPDPRHHEPSCSTPSFSSIRSIRFLMHP